MPRLKDYSTGEPTNDDMFIFDGTSQGTRAISFQNLKRVMGTGGSGGSYTAGDGISIVNGVISVNYPNGDGEVY